MKLSGFYIAASIVSTAAFAPPNSVVRRKCACVEISQPSDNEARFPTQLGMFDQLSSALTEVAQNFGGKQR